MVQNPELRVAKHFYPNSVLPYLMGVPAALVNDYRLYRAPDAEKAFRIQKSDLRIRPIWHKKQDRMEAHVLVCFLAYVLWKMLGEICRSKGFGNEPRRVFDELGKIRSVDVVMPVRAGGQIRKRCITRPTDHQAILFQKLGLNLPTHLKIM